MKYKTRNNIKENSTQEKVQGIIYVFVPVLVVLFLCISLFLTNCTGKSNIGEYKEGNISEIDFAFPTIERINSGYILEGQLLQKNELYHFYNYGIGEYKDGYYNHFHIATVDNENVYEFPTKICIQEEGACCFFSCKIDEKYLQIISENGIYITVEDPYGLKKIYYTDRKL